MFSLVVLQLQAQTLKTYSGPYGKGTATYQYYEDNNGERVYHGTFSYKGLEGTIKIVGSYKNGKRNGNWVGTLENHFYLLLTMTGTIQVNYLNGNREGISTYTLTRNVDKFDVSGKETETCKINFKNNIPSGEYYRTITSKVNSNAGKRDINTVTKGFFDENGYKTGDWNIQSIKNNFPTEEIKKYKKGYCYWYISRVSSTGEINKRFDSTEFANSYAKSVDEIFQKENYNYALGFPQGSEISGNFDFIGDNGVNPINDNTGDRYTIEDREGMPLPSFVGNIGWYAFLNGKYDKCIELSNKALSADSTLLFAKLNIALTKLKLKNSDYYNAYISAVSCCNNIEGRKETLEAGIKDINDLTEKERIPNADRAIQIIHNELEKMSNAERLLALKKQKEIEEEKEKQRKLEQERIELANSDFGKLIKQIKNELNRWERKTEFESEADYQNRLKNERTEKFSKIRDEALQKYFSLNQNLFLDNLSLVGRASKYDPEKNILNIRPAIVGGSYEGSVAVAVFNGYNTNLSDDYNKVCRNSEFNFKVSSALARAMNADTKAEIILIPKEFVLYNNNWRISKAFIIFNFDHSPGTVKSITATDKLVSIDIDVFVPAKNAILVNIPSRTKTKSVELLKFADLEQEFTQTNTLPAKIYYYFWTLEGDTNFSNEKLRELKVAISDIDGINK